MDEKELYNELGRLTKSKELWKENIGYVSSLLVQHSEKITAKALWMLGEMGLQHPEAIAPYVSKIVPFTDAESDLLRERAVNALGRIGRADYELIRPYFEKMFTLSKDSSYKVRLSFIWASENIATHTPTAYKESVPVFARLLDDENSRVRIEAPEMFRVLGKRKPEYVQPYLMKLKFLSVHDEERVVRIHALGAIKAIETSSAI